MSLDKDLRTNPPLEEGSVPTPVPGSGLLEQVLERITDGFMTLNSVWQFSYVNRKAGEILGRDAAELVGKHLWTDLPEGVAQKVFPSYYKALADQVTIVLEAYHAPWNRWFENRIYPSKDGLSVFFTDITERKEAEQSLARLETLMNGTTDLVGFSDAGGGILHVNPAGRRMMGVPADGPVPGTVLDFIPERLHQKYREEWTPAAFRDGVWRGESVLRSRDGREIPVSQVLVVHRKADGSVDFMSTIVRDITDRRRAEAVAREGEERYRLLVENAPEAILVFDPETERFVDCNQKAAFLLGYERDQLLKSKIRDCWPPAQPGGSAGSPAFLERIQDAQEGWAESFEWVHRTSSGRDVPCEVRLVRLPGAGDRTLVRASLVDITDRRRSIEALQESEARFRTMVENAPEAIVVLDVESGRIVDSNENALRLFGLGRAELCQRGIPAISPELQPGGRPSPEAAKDRVAEAAAGGRPVFEWIHRNARGQEFPCEVRLIRIPGGTSGLIRASITDISERKRAEAALLASEERFRQIAETVHDVFWVGAPDLSEVYFVTRAFEEIWGRKRTELYRSAAAWNDAIHSDDGGATLRVPRPEAGGVLDNTYRIIRPDGTIRWIHERAFPIFDASGSVTRRVGIAEDVTELKEAEAALRESRRQLEEALSHTQDRVVQLEEQARSRTSFG
ncbi:MAG TPA: PAS domain S-box protein, partial [Planctomycetota bacterium]|nr:PAS domain S-box protein [Planctomycetota bacterium]